VDADLERWAPTSSGCATSTCTGSGCLRVRPPRPCGYRTDDIDAGIENGLAFLATGPTDADALLGHALELGNVNYQVMAMLDGANTGSSATRCPPRCGSPRWSARRPGLRSRSARPGRVLEATAGTGINVYTHGELLPRTATPSCTSTPTAGNYGGAWQDQQRDFTAFPGPIVMTSNCLIEPQPAYRNRIFTTGPVGWPGIRPRRHTDLSLVVKAAQSLPGFTVDVPEETVTTGFATRCSRGRQGDRGGEGRRSSGSCSSAAATAPPRAATTTPMSPTTRRRTPC
jgi:hydroxylamine reductase